MGHGNTAPRGRQHLHGPPPGHDAGGVGQRVAARPAATLGDGRRPAGGGGSPAAGTGAARGGPAGAASAQPSAPRAAGPRRTGATRRTAGRTSAAAHADAVERPLQRDAARQRRRRQPARQHRHHALARRCAARRPRQLFLPAPVWPGHAGVADPAPGARRRSPLRGALSCRPGLPQRHLARPAQPHHGVGEPGRRHRAAPGGVVEHLAAADHTRPDVGLGSLPERSPRRRDASGLCQPFHQRRLGRRQPGIDADPQAAPRRRERPARGAIRRAQQRRPRHGARQRRPRPVAGPVARSLAAGGALRPRHHPERALPDRAGPGGRAGAAVDAAAAWHRSAHLCHGRLARPRRAAGPGRPLPASRRRGPLVAAQRHAGHVAPARPAAGTRRTAGGADPDHAAGDAARPAFGACAKRAVRPQTAVAPRHFWRPSADRRHLDGGPRHAPGAHLGARAVALGLGRCGLRPGAGQRRAAVLPATAAARVAGAARAARAGFGRQRIGWQRGAKWRPVPVAGGRPVGGRQQHVGAAGPRAPERRRPAAGPARGRPGGLARQRAGAARRARPGRAGQQRTRGSRPSGRPCPFAGG